MTQADLEWAAEVRKLRLALEAAQALVALRDEACKRLSIKNGCLRAALQDIKDRRPREWFPGVVTVDIDELLRKHQIAL